MMEAVVLAVVAVVVTVAVAAVVVVVGCDKEGGEDRDA